MVPGKMIPGKNGPRKKDPREKWSPKKLVPGKLRNKNRRVIVEHRGVCVCGMFGCDQPMKTQNLTTNLPGLL